MTLLGDFKTICGWVENATDEEYELMASVCERIFEMEKNTDRYRSALELIADIDPDDTSTFHDIANNALGREDCSEGDIFRDGADR